MIGAMFNGLSGLDSFQKALTTQANNIANVNTVAYKQDTVTFADMMYQEGAGKGAAISSVSKDFSQGELKITGKPYDVAIQGDGFFVVDDPKDNEYRYTRSGNFRMGKDGSLETPDHRNVLGVNTTITQAVATDENFNVFSSDFSKYVASQVVASDTVTKSINTRVTDYTKSAESDDAATYSGNGYKTAGIKMSDIELLSTAYRETLEEYAKDSSATDVASTQETRVYTFNLPTLDSENDYLEVFIDDAYVRQQYTETKEDTLKLFSDNISKLPGMTSEVDLTTLPDTATLTITGMVPGVSHIITDAKLYNKVTGGDTTEILATEDETQKVEAEKGSGTIMVENMRTALKTAVERAGAKFLEIGNEVTHITSTAGLNPIELQLNDLNLSTDPYGEIEFDEKGLAYIEQDGNRFVVGQMGLVRFVDNLELTPMGNNVFTHTELSGEPFLAGESTVVVGNALEMSNTNMAVGLTDLMVYQRAYEANARSLTTSDEFLNIAIQLKK